MSLIGTRPLEQVVMTVPGVRRVRSRSIRGASEISAQFDPSTDMVVALQMVQNRVAEIRGDLPADTQLQIERMTPAIFPVFILSLTGALPTADLYDYANFVVKPEIARIPGAGLIEVQASDTREIEVILDPAKLTAAELTVVDVSDALKTQNTVVPVGRFQESGLQHLTLASGLWKSIDQIAQAPVKIKNGATIRVSDVGTVTRGAPDRTLLVTGNGRDAVSMTIAQQIGANIIDLKAGLDSVLASLTQVLPAGITISRVYDLAEFVEESIASVRDAILIGGFLAIVVLLVFLRDWRLTAIAAVTLPMAVIPTFAFMWLFKGTINLMSMGGLAVAIGLVIDDAVVVVENIHRRAGEGGSSVADAVQQLLGPLISSTLTTVVVFAPLGLLSGVPGQFFRALSLSLSVAILISLVLSITVVPLMARRAVIHHRPTGESHGRIDRAYGRLLGVMVGQPRVAVVFAVLLAALTVGLFYRVGTGFFPAADEGGFVLDYLTPAGSALSETDRQVRTIERIVSETPEVASYSRRTGSELGLFATAQNTGDILVRLTPRSQRSRSSEEIINDVRTRVQEAVPLVEVEFVQLLQDMLGDLEGNPEPIEVKIFGDDPDRLAELSMPVEEMMNKVDGVVDVVGVQRGNPEVTWNIDPVAAGRYGLTVEQVQNQMAGAWLGDVATDLRLADRTIPVRVRLVDSFRFDPNKLPSTLIRTADGKPFPVSEVATMERANGQGELLRENLRPMAVVSGRLEGPRSGEHGRRHPIEPRQAQAADRLHVRDWRAIPGAGAGLPRAADGLRAGRCAGIRDPRHPVPCMGAGDSHPARGTALARRRAPAAAAHWHRPEHLVGHGTHPARRPRGEERDHAARLLREAARAGRALRNSDRSRGAHSSQTDPDDDVLYVVRASAARAGAWRRRGAAEAARADRDRRARAVDTCHPAGRPRPVCGD